MKNPWIGAAVFLLLGGLSRAENVTAGKTETVIVPYDSTKPLNAQKPDQFYLPYEHFLQLWEAAKKNREQPVSEPAAAQFILSSARYDGVITERAATFVGKLDVTTYNDPWIKVPLAFKDVKVSSLKIDGSVAAFDGDRIVVEKPGRHSLEVAFEIPLRPGATAFAWGIPRTSATLLALTLPDERTRGFITPARGVIERAENGHNLVSAALGATDRIRVDLQAAVTARVTEPAVATLTTKLVVRPGVEEADVQFAFGFPGARQDRFTVYLENGLALFGLDALNLKSWKLSPNAGRQALEITLNEPAKEAFAFSIQTQRALPALPTEQAAPVFSAAAKRLDYSGTGIFMDDRLDITAKPNAGQRQVPWTGEACADARLIAAYAGAGKLAYSVKLAATKREARVDYVYQVNRRKIELLASLQLFSKGDDLSAMTINLPAQFEVQAVESERLQDWWREGNTLHLRFRGATPEMTPLVVYLARQYAAAPTELDVRPLTLDGFKSVTGEAVIAAHKGVDVAMKLTAEGSEIAAAKAATDFQILPPLERKRGFTFKTQTFAAEVTLAALPAKMNALWVMHAQAHEGWVALSTHARLTVRQGSIDRASFSLPKSAPEARVTGSEVRETRSHIDSDGKRRIYEVQFQNDVYESVEFTLDFEVPDAEEAQLPDIAFPDSQMTSGFVLTENVSEYEMRLKSSGADPVPSSEIPFLPELTKGAGIFRVQPGWTIAIALDRLEKAASRSAFVAWAEMTSALRADGAEWHRASYRLQNRSLQFLPVRMPKGAELMSVRVAGQNVRADTGQVEGRETLLVPLIKTKPGDLSYDVELVYRLTGAEPGWRAKREFQEPELPGITVERTLWNVWLPDNRKLQNSGGNMEPVLGDLNKTEKLEGKLQELKQLVSIANSSQLSDDARQNARRNIDVLQKELEVDNRDQEFSETNSYGLRGGAPKPTPGDETVGKKALAQQWGYVENKRKAVTREVESEVRKVAEKQPEPLAKIVSKVGAGVLKLERAWSNNSTYSGTVTVNQGVQGVPNLQVNGGALDLNGSNSVVGNNSVVNNGGSNVFLNDNVVLQQGQTLTGVSGADVKIVSGNRSGVEAPHAAAPQPAAKAQGDVVFQTARGNNLYYKQQEAIVNQTVQLAESAKEKQVALKDATGPAAMAAPAAAPMPAEALTKTGSGTLTFGSGKNTFTGATTIAGGTLTAGSATSGTTVTGGNTIITAGVGRLTSSIAGLATPQITPASPAPALSLGNATIELRSDSSNVILSSGGLISGYAVQGAPSANAGTPPNPAADSAKAEAMRLQTTGRISLAVDFPTEGQVYHFKKVKASARLELTVLNSSALTRWWNLAIALLLAAALYALGRLFEKWSISRRNRTA